MRDNYSLESAAETLGGASILFLDDIDFGKYDTGIQLLNIIVSGVLLVDATQSLLRERRPYIAIALSYLRKKAQPYLEKLLMRRV